MTVVDTEPDYSEPLATLLRQGTAKAHEDAENSQGAAWLVRGELDKEEYVRFLIMLHYVYSALEQGLDRHASHSTLVPTYNPTLLARAPGLSADIAHLLQVPEDGWRAHPLHTALAAALPAPLAAYVSRIETLANSSDPSRLLAHAYVRYLGDLSGGQVIRRRVQKAYGLQEEGGAGTRFYEFEKLGGGGQASAGDARRIKEWYRDGMNQGAGDDAAKKKEIVDEAIRVFDLNTALFTTLRPPSINTEPTAGVRPPLGDTTPPPTSPTSPTSPSSLTAEKSKVVAQLPAPAERTYSMTSVLALVLAMSVAHFVLVVGGFTGERGHLKFQAVQQWLFPVKA